MSKTNNELMAKLQALSLNEMGEVAYANYGDRESAARANVRKAFDLAASKQPESIKEKLGLICNKVIQAIEHVGAASYSHREAEARTMINEAFSD
jgi:hypothetical protein